MRKRELVRRDAVIIAWGRWYAVSGGSHTDLAMFGDFVADSKLYDRRFDTHAWLDVSYETARKIALLNSPHYYAVIKAHYARHPWK